MKTISPTALKEWISTVGEPRKNYPLYETDAVQTFISTSVNAKKYVFRMESYYDQKTIEDLEFTKKINSVLDAYKELSKKITLQYENCQRTIQDKQLEEIKKETYLLAPFIKSKKTHVGIKEDLNGLLVSIQNSSNSLSIVASGDRKLTFSYVVKKGKRNSMSIDGFIDLNDEDDNINYIGLKKILSIYGGE